MVSRARVGRSLSWSCCLCYFKTSFLAGIALAHLVPPLPLAGFLVALLLGVWFPTAAVVARLSRRQGPLAPRREESLRAVLSHDKSIAFHGSASLVRDRAKERPLKKRKTLKMRCREEKESLLYFPP